ncbi:MAG TPA: hypothetical protein VGI81_18760 [Tepidisphaeraceae bacterium]
MPKPHPKPIDPSELVDLALAVVRANRFPHLATADGFTVYVANLRAYHKTGEITASGSCGNGPSSITRFRFDGRTKNGSANGRE